MIANRYISFADEPKNIIYFFVFLLLAAPEPVALSVNIPHALQHLHQSLILLQYKQRFLSFLLQSLVLHC